MFQIQVPLAPPPPRAGPAPRAVGELPAVVHYCFHEDDTEAAKRFRARLQSLDNTFKHAIQNLPPGVSDAKVKEAVHHVAASCHVLVNSAVNPAPALHVNGPACDVDEAVGIAQNLLAGHEQCRKLIEVPDTVQAHALRLLPAETGLQAICNQLSAAAQQTGVMAAPCHNPSRPHAVIQLTAPQTLVDDLHAQVTAEVERLAETLTTLRLPLPIPEHHYLTTAAARPLLMRAEADGVSVLLDQDQVQNGAGRKTRGGAPDKNAQKDLLYARVGENLTVRVTTCDIFAAGTDVIVNAANPKLQHIGGIARVIADRAGPAFEAESAASVQARGQVRVGQARATSGGNLSVRHVIHAVAPMYNEVTDRQIRPLLAGAFFSAMEVAHSVGAHSVAIPSLGTGVFNWWPQVAAEQAVIALRRFAHKYPNVRLLVVLMDEVAKKADFFAKYVRAAALAARTNAPAATNGLQQKNAAAGGGGTLRQAGSMSHCEEAVLPPLPVLPSHQWYYDDRTERFDNKNAAHAWIPYDYDQNMQLEAALARGDEVLEIFGDRLGVVPTHAKKLPGASAPMYKISLRDLTQTNVASKWRRHVKRAALGPRDPPPPNYAEVLASAKEARALHVSRMQAEAKQRAVAAPDSLMDCPEDVPVTLLKQPPASSSIAPTTGTPGNAVIGEQPASADAHTQEDTADGFGTAPTTVLLCGCGDKPQKNMDAIRAGIARAYTRTTMQAPDQATAAAVLQLREVVETLCRADMTARATDTGAIELRYLRRTGLKAVQTAVFKGLSDVLAAERTPYNSLWTAPDGTGPFVPDVEQPFALLDVASGSAEFVEAERNFLTGGFAAKVTRVQRVQTLPLWERFTTEVQHIRRFRGQGNENIVYPVFHGTCATQPETVAEGGFDYRYAASDQLFFGKGAYFAESMTYSHHYAYKLPEDKGKQRQAFMARLVAGKVEEREHNRDNTIIHPKKEFDSVRGLVSETMHAYVIYGLYMAYPEYLVTYALA